MALVSYPLPDVGEGLTEAEIVSWKVAPGDQVSLNQVVCEIETAKSLVELPSPFEGTVEAVLAKEGDTVAVGATILTIRDAAPDAPVPDSDPVVVEVSGAVGDVESTVAQDEGAAEPKN
ncbi:MAG: biotin/lipoyl-containing protein, partial [Pontimonas sp.]